MGENLIYRWKSEHKKREAQPQVDISNHLWKKMSNFVKNLNPSFSLKNKKIIYKTIGFCAALGNYSI